MVQLKLSFLLSTAAALSLPLAAKAQEKESNFLTCIMQNLFTGGISIGGDMSQVIASVVASCCPEGTEEPTCTALKCMNYEAGTMVEPCTCGEVMNAQQAMKADESLVAQITTFMPDAFSSTEDILKSCCPSEQISATEFNTCLTDLKAQTTVATEPAVETTTEATEPAATTEAATETTTEATEPAATTEAATETTSTVANVTPASAPSSGSIASVSLPIMVAYVLFNYVM